MANQRVLIHICCAPCLLGTLDRLRQEDLELRGIFYNPNIHPFMEFRKRLKAMRVFMEQDPLPVMIDEEYGLDFFVNRIYSGNKSQRCANCFEVRLRRAAEETTRMGFDSFTTTLLGSPHQDHELVSSVGERVAAEAGVGFLYRDFRPYHDQGHEDAKRRQLYRQQYCGCCFSEYERYKDTSKELYRGEGRPAE